MEIESMRLELDSKTSLKLQNGPPELQDDVECYQAELLDPVQAFYHKKREELDQYARHKISDAQSAAEKHGDRSNDDMDRKLKSIVKRRPPVADKRVKFSQSPPRVELLTGDDEEDDDCHKKEEKPDVASIRGSDISSPEEQHRDDSKDNAASHSTGNIDSSSSTTQSLIDIRMLSPRYELPKFTNMPALPPNNDTHVQEDLSAFEDVIDVEETGIQENPINSVLAHHADFGSNSRRSSSVSSNDSTVPSATDGAADRDVGVIPPFTVGSAPLDILPKQGLLEHDGGRPEKTEIQRKIDSFEDTDLGISMNANLDKLMSLDPSQMSFSQRVEWEQFRKANKVMESKDLATEIHSH